MENRLNSIMFRLDMHVMLKDRLKNIAIVTFLFFAADAHLLSAFFVESHCK